MKYAEIIVSYDYPSHMIQYVYNIYLYLYVLICMYTYVFMQLRFINIDNYVKFTLLLKIVMFN